MLPPPGNTALPTRCQEDPDCWADFIATCEDVVEGFIAINPEELVDEAEATLTELGMMRYGDEGYADDVRGYLTERKASLHEDLERHRFLPDYNGDCPEGLEQCNDGTCGTAEQCVERICPRGTQWCEGREQCISPYEVCPDCDEEAPYFCAPAESCVADSDTCASYCEGPYPYCPYYNACVPFGYCPSGEDPDVDAGVGIGGFGGDGMMPLPVD
jgi:hypothetical protein